VDIADDTVQSGTEYERRYPQLDCAGVYLWIWERVMLADGRLEVVARRIDRLPPPPATAEDQQP
jgi:hypothetical protein